MENKIYNQKKSSFSFLRVLLITINVFCLLFIGYYCLNSFFYKIKRTNSGLTYWVVSTNAKELDETTPFNIKDYEFILFERVVSYKGKIIEQRRTFTRLHKDENGNIMYLPYFEKIETSSLKCIDGDLYELLMLSRPDVVLEGKILAINVMSKMNLLFYKLYDSDSKVNVTIYPIAFCSQEDLPKNISKYNIETNDLQEKQKQITLQKIKKMFSEKNPQQKYKEIENGIVIEKNDGDGEGIQENDMVKFEGGFYNFGTGELIFTTSFDEAREKGGNNFRQNRKYKPIEVKMQSTVLSYFKGLKKGGEYEIYSPLQPEFFGDTRIYCLKIKIIDVKHDNKISNTPEIGSEGNQEISNNENGNEGNQEISNKDEKRDDKQKEEESDNKNINEEKVNVNKEEGKESKNNPINDNKNDINDEKNDIKENKDDSNNDINDEKNDIKENKDDSNGNKNDVNEKKNDIKENKEQNVENDNNKKNDNGDNHHNNSGEEKTDSQNL